MKGILNPSIVHNASDIQCKRRASHIRIEDNVP